MDLQILARRPDLLLINKMKWTCQQVDFAVLADQRVKIKESKKIDKFLHLARELKKLWNVKVTVIPIVVGVFGTVLKGIEKRLEELVMRERI